MKARFMTKTALSALALAFAGALPGVAQQTASPAAVPAVNKVKASAVEKAFMNQMAGVVQASLKAGALDMKAVTEILNAAVKAGVSDQVMGSLVSMAAGAFPGSAPAVASAAVKSYGTQVTEANVRNVIASAVAVQPHPYASVSPISEAVTKALWASSMVANAVPGIAVGVAAQTPDNPLQGVTTQTSGLVRPGEEASGGALVLPGGLPVGGSATSPAPISNPAGN